MKARISPTVIHIDPAINLETLFDLVFLIGAGPAALPGGGGAVAGVPAAMGLAGVVGAAVAGAIAGAVAGVTATGATGAGVTGAGVTGAGVTGAGVTGAAITGAGVTGAAVVGTCNFLCILRGFASSFALAITANTKSSEQTIIAFLIF